MFCCRTVIEWSFENFQIIIKFQGSITVVKFVQHKKTILNQKKTDWQQIVVNEVLIVATITEICPIENSLERSSLHLF